LAKTALLAQIFNQSYDFKINEKLEIEAVSCRFCQTDVISSGIRSFICWAWCVGRFNFCEARERFFCFSFRVGKQALLQTLVSVSACAVLAMCLLLALDFLV